MKKFIKKYNQISKGMHYVEVKAILGEPLIFTSKRISSVQPNKQPKGVTNWAFLVQRSGQKKMPKTLVLSTLIQFDTVVLRRGRDYSPRS